MKREYKIGILGATGVVGQELINQIEKREIPIAALKLFASNRSSGKYIPFKGENIRLEEVSHHSFKGLDFLLSSASGSLSQQFLPYAVKDNVVCIDNTSHFRLQDDVPLIIPEINPEMIQKHNGIIANPNCSTIIMLLPLYPLHQKQAIKRIVVSTYQAASGAGLKAIQELEKETEAFLQKKSFDRTVMPHPYAFNLFAHDSKMLDNGYCQEEMKMYHETRKIFNSNISITATCIRVPIARAHSESINVEFHQKMTVEKAYELIKNAKGVSILENRDQNRWPMPIDATGKDDIFVGRIRKDISQPNALEMWVVGDQILKGAALNAIQILEKII